MLARPPGVTVLLATALAASSWIAPDERDPPDPLPVALEVPIQLAAGTLAHAASLWVSTAPVRAVFGPPHPSYVVHRTAPGPMPSFDLGDDFGKRLAEMFLAMGFSATLSATLPPGTSGIAVCGTRWVAKNRCPIVPVLLAGAVTSAAGIALALASDVPPNEDRPGPFLAIAAATTVTQVAVIQWSH